MTAPIPSVMVRIRSKLVRGIVGKVWLVRCGMRLDRGFFVENADGSWTFSGQDDCDRILDLAGEISGLEVIDRADYDAFCQGGRS